MKQEELAEQAYVRPAFIGQIERGETNPSLVSIALLANALGCQVADFFPRKALTDGESIQRRFPQ